MRSESSRPQETRRADGHVARRPWRHAKPSDCARRRFGGGVAVPRRQGRPPVPTFGTQRRHVEDKVAVFNSEAAPFAGRVRKREADRKHARRAAACAPATTPSRDSPGRASASTPSANRSRNVAGIAGTVPLLGQEREASASKEYGRAGDACLADAERPFGDVGGTLRDPESRPCFPGFRRSDRGTPERTQPGNARADEFELSGGARRAVVDRQDIAVLGPVGAEYGERAVGTSVGGQGRRRVSGTCAARKPPVDHRGQPWIGQTLGPKSKDRCFLPRGLGSQERRAVGARAA